jgi:hypothetical protein
LVTDGHHSVPTKLTLQADNQAPITVDVAPTTDKPEQNATTTVRVATPSLSFSKLRVTVAEVREVTTIDFYSSTNIATPVGIAELGIPGLQVGTAPDTVRICDPRLMLLDGEGIAACATGSRADALAGKPLRFTNADGGPLTVRLPAGSHVIEQDPVSGGATGLEVDQLVMTSDIGGGAAPTAAGGRGWTTTTPTATPEVKV